MRFRRRETGLGGWLCAFMAAIPFVAGAVPAPFPPGLEKDIDMMVGDSALSNGCQPNGIRIESTYIDVQIACGTETGVLRLTSLEDSEAEAFRRTASFVLQLREPVTPRVRAAANELAGHIAERDKGTILSKASVIRSLRTDQAVGASARALGLLDNLRRGVVWMALLGCLILLCIAAVRRPATGIAWLAFLALTFVGALIVRLKLGYWAPIHANGHGIAELRGLVSSSGEWQGPVESDRYGAAYRQIVHLVLQIGRGGPHGAFLFSVIASALGVIPLAILGRQLTGSRLVGGIAALGLAFHPIHIALSATESSFGLAGTLFLIGAACLCAIPSLTKDEDRARAWWGGALALSAACELSVITLALPVAAALLAAAVVGRQDRRFWLAPLLVLVASMALHLDSIWPVLRQAQQTRGEELTGTLGSFRGDRNALMNETLAAPTLAPLALLGLVTLIVFRRRVGLALAAASGLLLFLSASVNGCRTDVIRYQPVGHLLLFIAAGAVLLWIPARVRAGQVGAAALIAVALLPPTRAAFAALRKPFLDVSAYRVAEQAAASSPSSLEVLIPPPRMAGRDVLSDFPDFVFQAAGKTIHVSTPGHEPESLIGPRYVWISQACYSFTGKEAATGEIDRAVKMGSAPLRPECEPLVAEIDPTKEPLIAAELPVPFREWEFLKVPAKPLVGLFPATPPKTSPQTASVPVPKP